MGVVEFQKVLRFVDAVLRYFVFGRSLETSLATVAAFDATSAMAFATAFAVALAAARTTIKAALPWHGLVHLRDEQAIDEAGSQYESL